MHTDAVIITGIFSGIVIIILVIGFSYHQQQNRIAAADTCEKACGATSGRNKIDTRSDARHTSILRGREKILKLLRRGMYK